MRTVKVKNNAGDIFEMPDEMRIYEVGDTLRVFNYDVCVGIWEVVSEESTTMRRKAHKWDPKMRTYSSCELPEMWGRKKR